MTPSNDKLCGVILSWTLNATITALSSIYVIIIFRAGKRAVRYLTVELWILEVGENAHF